MKLIIFIIATLFSMMNDAFAAVQIFDFNTRTYESLESLSQRLPSRAQYLLGEFHYNKKIQQAQADFISQMVQTHQSAKAFDVNWEFLNYKDHAKIQENFRLYSLNQITVAQFLNTFNQGRGIAYQPILEVIKEFDGNLYGVNATRLIKKQIIKGGLGSISSNDIPPNMDMGSDLYFQLFKKAMGGHVNEEELKAYYLAQCYTDSVMSYHMTEFSTNPLSFLVVGSFHSDYGLGTAMALKKLGRHKVINLKFVDKAALSTDDLLQLLSPSRKLGKVADYLVLLD
jgi:uncharacterized iron-regulated protein